jgi:hypothetical protein
MNGMKKIIGIFLLGLPMLSLASNCDEVSGKIAEKIKNNGVDESKFQLKLVPTDQSQQQHEGKLVGFCDNGQKNIFYVRLDGVSTKSSKSTNKKVNNKSTKTKVKVTDQNAELPELKIDTSVPSPKTQTIPVIVK